MDAITVEEVQDLQARLKETNAQISSLTGQQQAKREQLIAILEKYGVKNVKEFRSLVAQKGEAAQKLYSQVEEYIDQSSQVIKKLDQTLRASDEESL